MLVPDLVGVIWLWPFTVQDHIYGRSNFGHRFCLLAQERLKRSPKKVTHTHPRCWFSGRQLICILTQSTHSYYLELRSSPIQISQGNLITTLPTWGPSYRITFELYINSFDGANLKNGKLAELLRLTTTDGNCCAIGDRIPAIFTDKGGFIQVGTQIGNMGNKWKNVNLNEKTWYRLDLMQYTWNNKVSWGSKGVITSKLVC